ncbi:MAG: N-acetylmuramoyl-L-alanine amidase, partial [Saccharofermentans sp.]|nr:N-acetylmuramoyl-L-alanine amidase [Saccharofermentans sp.]
MISEDNKRKFQAIVASLSPEQRAQLLSHIQSLPENQRGAVVEQVIARYEQHNARNLSTERKAPVVTSTSVNNNVPNENESPIKPQRINSETPVVVPQRRSSKKKRRIKSQVYLWAIVVLLVIGIIAFIVLRRNTLFANLGVTSGESSVEETVEPSVTPTPTTTPTPSPTPAPTLVPLADDHPDLTGMTIVLDAGHQETTDNEQEAYASWLSATKPRCTSGGTGVVSGIPEYELTLEYSNIIREYLEQCGAEVIMIREENDVNISNQERAQIAVNAAPDLLLRVTADSDKDAIT